MCVQAELQAEHKGIKPQSPIPSEKLLLNVQGSDKRIQLFESKRSQQSHSWMDILLSDTILWIRGRVGVASLKATTENPDSGSEYGLVQAMACTFTGEAVQSGIGHTVQRGQQQRKVVVVEDS